MKIIGLSSHRSGVHDNSAVLMENGKVIFAEAEERISRVKHDGRFPWHVIKEIFSIRKLRVRDIDYFASANPEESIFQMFLTSLKFIPTVGLREYLAHSFRRFFYKIDKIYDGNAPKSYAEANLPEGKLIKVSHYLAHAAAAYYFGPFDDCLIVVMDGFGPGEKGEPLSGEIYFGKNGKISSLEKVPVWGTLGLYYGAVTKALGFKLNDGEGKTMGLAVYGKPDSCYRQMKTFFPSFFKNKWSIQPSIMDILNIQRKGVFEKTEAFLLLKSYIDKYGRENVAAAAQKVFEEELEKYIRYLVKKYKQRKIVCAGGIFLNVKANMRLLQNRIVDDIFVYPNPADGGTAVGAALVVFLQKGVKIKKVEMIHSAYGRQYRDSEILKELKKTKGISYIKFGKNLPTKVSKLLIQGKVIGWFEGKGEWGPRALGQRSVVADPRYIDIKDRINEILKGREWFMPFAPSMLAERAPDYLKTLRKAPFMIIADDTVPKKRGEIKAAIHIDHTARPQLVTKEASPLYYSLIKEFEKLTGVGAILNTSFNKHGLPIVYSPKDAIEHLKWGTIDLLMIGPYLVERKR